MRTKKDKPVAEPLATKVRAALASDWRTLAALDTLTAARGSDARRLVHEALRTLKGEGCVLEERVGKAGVEVRLLTLPAPVPDDGQPGDLSPEDIEAIRNALLEAEADGDGAAYTDEIPPLSPAAAARMADLIEHPPAPSEALRALCRGGDEPDDYTRFHAALAVGVGALDALPICGGATCPDCEHAITQLEDHALTCANGRRDAPWWDAKRAAYGAEIEAHVKASTPSGASAQERAVAFAGEAIRRRREGLYKAPTLDAPAPPVGQAVPVEPPRERTAAEWIASHNHDAAPAPKGPGPASRCAVCGERYHGHGSEEQRGHPFTPKPRGRPRARLAAAQAADLDVEELPAPAEQAAILDGAKRDYEAAVAEGRASAEPETSRGGSEDSDDASTTDGDRPTGGVGMGREATPRAKVARKPRVPGAQADQVAPTDRAASAPGVDVARAPDAVVRCRPPLCHADAIHEPARVRSFARPLCEAHRAWVEGAGGTVASEADVSAHA